MDDQEAKPDLDKLMAKVQQSHQEAKKLWMRIEKLNASIEATRAEIKKLREKKSD